MPTTPNMLHRLHGPKSLTGFKLYATSANTVGSTMLGPGPLEVYCLSEQMSSENLNIFWSNAISNCIGKHRCHPLGQKWRRVERDLDWTRRMPSDAIPKIAINVNRHRRGRPKETWIDLRETGAVAYLLC